MKNWQALSKIDIITNNNISETNTVKPTTEYINLQKRAIAINNGVNQNPMTYTNKRGYLEHML